MSRRRRWEGYWRGEAARAERVGRCCLLVLGVELKGNKKTKINYFVALDGSRTELQTQQPTKNTCARRGMYRRGGSADGERRGGAIDRLGTIKLGGGGKK